MDTNRDTNPYKLKEKEVDWKEGEKVPSGYLDSSSFLSYLQKKELRLSEKTIFQGLQKIMEFQ